MPVPILIIVVTTLIGGGYYFFTAKTNEVIEDEKKKLRETIYHTIQVWGVQIIILLPFGIFQYISNRSLGSRLLASIAVLAMIIYNVNKIMTDTIPRIRALNEKLNNQAINFIIQVAGLKVGHILADPYVENAVWCLVIGFFIRSIVFGYFDVITPWWDAVSYGWKSIGYAFERYLGWFISQ